MKSKLPKQKQLTKTRLWLVDNFPLTDGSLMYPIAAAYAAAVDALEWKVRFVDCGIAKLDLAGARDLFHAVTPDEVVWASGREPWFEHPCTRFFPGPFDQPVFPILDRWQAENYHIKHAPNARPWQLQIYCLPMGPEWFAEYIADLRHRFPAFTNAVIFGLDNCQYTEEALTALRTLHVPWSVLASDELLRRASDLRAAGCIGAVVDASATDPAAACHATLRGLAIHGIGTDGAAALRLPLAYFGKIPKRNGAAEVVEPEKEKTGT